MPAPAHTKVLFTGILGTTAAPVEIWQFGLSLGYSIPDHDAPQADLQAMANACSTAWTSISSSISSVARLQRVRVVQVDNDGKYRRDATGKYKLADKTSDQPGTSASQPHPWQVAFAATLQSGFPGPTGRGRIYVPLPTVSIVAAEGIVSVADRDTFRGRVVALVNAVNAAATTSNLPAFVAVPSGGSPSQGLAPAMHRVTGVSVGRRLDTQRRRAEDVPDDRGVPQAVA